LNDTLIVLASPRKTLARIGELELAVLEHLWSAGEADVLMTHAAIGTARGITTNTVGSALERLHRKGLVVREKISHAYRYQSALTREEFAAKRMLDAAAGQRTLTDAGLLAAFVDLVAEEDEASLDRLEALIAEKRSKRGKE
jgi:predicted transcriptional regulator